MQNTPQIFGYLSDIELYEFALAITAKDTFQCIKKILILNYRAIK